MQQPDFQRLVDTAIATLGGSPTSKEVEAAALRLFEKEKRMSTSESPPIQGIRASISLASCSSRRSTTQRTRVYDRVRSITGKLVEAHLKASLGSPWATSSVVRIDLRDTQHLWAGHNPLEYLSIYSAAEQAILDAGGVPGLGPFVDLSLPQNFGFLDVLSEIVQNVHSLVPHFQLATEYNPLDTDVLRGLGMALAIHSHKNPGSAAQLALSVNASDSLAFGRPYHESVTALSTMITGLDNSPIGEQFGRKVAASCTTCFQWAQSEIDLAHSFQPSEFGALRNGMDPNCTINHSFFPSYGLKSNRVSFPPAITFFEIQETLSSRLEAFALAGKTAGLWIQC